MVVDDDRSVVVDGTNDVVVAAAAVVVGFVFDAVVVAAVVVDDDAVVAVVVDIVVDVGASSASWAYQEPLHSSLPAPYLPYHTALVLLLAGLALILLAVVVDTSFVLDLEIVEEYIA